MSQRSVYLLLLVFLLPMSLLAQRSHSLSIGLGSALYYGDLSDRTQNNLLVPGFAVGYQLYLLPSLSLRADLVHTQIGASDRNATDPARRARNLSFRSPLTDVSFVGVWELPDKHFGKRWTRQFHLTPYVFGGIGGFFFNPQAEYGGEWHDLQPLGTEGQYLGETNYPKPYALRQWQIPLGVGLSMRFSQQLGVHLDMTYHTTFTDYIDDVSTRYPVSDALRLQGGDIAAVLSNRSQGRLADGAQRGNPGANDSYVVFKAGLNVYFQPWLR